MSNEADFVEGLIAKPPHENAPDFVIAKLSIKREELIEWLQGRDGEWINADVKEAKSGKWYVAVDSWKPQEGNTSSSGPRGGAPKAQRRTPDPDPDPTNGSDFDDDDIPFVSNRSVY